MGSGIRGDFGNTKGAALAAAISSNYIMTKALSPNKNINKLSKIYDYDIKTGKFGVKSKNSQVIKSSDPIADSKKFFDLISKGGIKSKLSNGKGYRTDFADGTVITHRIKTSISGSPAVDIHVKTRSKGEIATQKIHFE